MCRYIFSFEIYIYISFNIIIFKFIVNGNEKRFSSNYVYQKKDPIKKLAIRWKVKYSGFQCINEATWIRHMYRARLNMHALSTNKYRFYTGTFCSAENVCEYRKNVKKRDTDISGLSIFNGKTRLRQTFLLSTPSMIYKELSNIRTDI